MADLFAWIVKEADGSEGPVAAVIPGVGSAAVPLVSMKRKIIDALALYAVAHAALSGKPVRLVRFTEAETLRRLGDHGDATV
jgi:hypothetical protein